MKVVILAGGLGTRLAEETAARPKPMVEIGSQPVLWHIMKLYAHYGFRDFIICLGYKAEIVKRHFLFFYHLASDLTLSLGDGGTVVHGSRSEDWLVTLVDTGLVTETGGRLRRVRELVGDSTFLLTYGDGVGDVNLADLVSFHRRHGKLATLTAVRPPARFGVLGLEGDRVVRYVEKPESGEDWVSAGFFVFEPGVFDYLTDDETMAARTSGSSSARSKTSGGKWGSRRAGL
jgi:glucose-1-phosphate cytidylyltransferase